MLIMSNSDETKKACKYLTYKPLSWVPGRTRTVDIQNHKLPYGISGNAFIHRQCRILNKSYLRRFAIRIEKRGSDISLQTSIVLPAFTMQRLYFLVYFFKAFRRAFSNSALLPCSSSSIVIILSVSSCALVRCC